MLELLNDRRYPFLLFSQPLFGDTIAFLGVLIAFICVLFFSLFLFLYGRGLGNRIQMSGVGFNDQCMKRKAAIDTRCSIFLLIIQSFNCLYHIRQLQPWSQILEEKKGKEKAIYTL